MDIRKNEEVENIACRQLLTNVENWARVLIQLFALLSHALIVVDPTVWCYFKFDVDFKTYSVQLASKLLDTACEQLAIILTM